MIRGLTGSIALHAGIIAAGYFAWPYVETESEYVQAIPVTVTTVADVIDIAPIPRRREEPPEEPPEEVAPPDMPDVEEMLESLPDETAPEPEPEEPEPQAPPAPPPEAEPEEVVQVPEETEAETPEPEEAEDEPEPEPEPETPEPQVVVPPEPETDALDDLLADDSLFNIDPEDQKRAPPPPPREEPKELPQATPEEQRRGAGAGERAVATVEAMLVSQMKVCWDDVQDLPDPERLLVVIRVRLNENGTLKGEPELVKPRPGQMIGDRPMNTAVSRAILATQRCGRNGYKLPPEYYDLWNEITFTVGPDQ